MVLPRLLFFFLLSFVFSCEGLPPTETHTCHAPLLSLVCISHYKQHYVCRAQGWPTHTSQIVRPNGTFSWIPKILVSAEGNDKRLGIKCLALKSNVGSNVGRLLETIAS